MLAVPKGVNKHNTNNHKSPAIPRDLPRDPRSHAIVRDPRDPTRSPTWALRGALWRSVALRGAPWRPRRSAVLRALWGLRRVARAWRGRGAGVPAAAKC
eukprot:gene12865-biopygen3935